MVGNVDDAKVNLALRSLCVVLMYHCRAYSAYVLTDRTLSDYFQYTTHRYRSLNILYTNLLPTMIRDEEADTPARTREVYRMVIASLSPLVQVQGRVLYRTGNDVAVGILRCTASDKNE